MILSMGADSGKSEKSGKSIIQMESDHHSSGQMALEEARTAEIRRLRQRIPWVVASKVTVSWRNGLISECREPSSTLTLYISPMSSPTCTCLPFFIRKGNLHIMTSSRFPTGHLDKERARRDSWCLYSLKHAGQDLLFLRLSDWMR